VISLDRDLTEWGLVGIGVLVVFYLTGAAPAGVVLVNILLAAIFAPLLVRIICCAYENP
jgi:hypothetical protein